MNTKNKFWNFLFQELKNSYGWLEIFKILVKLQNISKICKNIVLKTQKVRTSLKSHYKNLIHKTNGETKINLKIDYSNIWMSILKIIINT